MVLHAHYTHPKPLPYVLSEIGFDCEAKMMLGARGGENIGKAHKESRCMEEGQEPVMFTRLTYSD